MAVKQKIKMKNKFEQIMDSLFLGFHFGVFPKTISYFMIPMICLSLMQYFGVDFVTDSVLKIVSCILAVPTIIGFFWMWKNITKDK